MFLYDYLWLQDVLGNKFQLLNKNIITTFEELTGVFPFFFSKDTNSR